MSTGTQGIEKLQSEIIEIPKLTRGKRHSVQRQSSLSLIKRYNLLVSQVSLKHISYVQP